MPFCISSYLYVKNVQLRVKQWIEWFRLNKEYKTKLSVTTCSLSITWVLRIHLSPWHWAGKILENQIIKKKKKKKKLGRWQLHHLTFYPFEISMFSWSLIEVYRNISFCYSIFDFSDQIGFVIYLLAFFLFRKNTSNIPAFRIFIISLENNLCTCDIYVYRLYFYFFFILCTIICTSIYDSILIFNLRTHGYLLVVDPIFTIHLHRCHECISFNNFFIYLLM